MREIISRSFTVVDAACISHLSGLCQFHTVVHNPSAKTYYLYDPKMGQPADKNLGSLTIRELGEEEVQVYSLPPPPPSHVDIFSLHLTKIIEVQKRTLSKSGLNLLLSLKKVLRF